MDRHVQLPVETGFSGRQNTGGELESEQQPLTERQGLRYCTEWPCAQSTFCLCAAISLYKRGCVFHWIYFTAQTCLLLSSFKRNMFFNNKMGGKGLFKAEIKNWAASFACNNDNDSDQYTVQCTHVRWEFLWKTSINLVITGSTGQ